MHRSLSCRYAFLSTTKDTFGAYFVLYCGIGEFHSGNFYSGHMACELVEKYKKGYYMNIVSFMVMVAPWLRTLGWKKATPGQILIWQAENPMPQYSLRQKFKLLLQVIKACLLGNWRYLRLSPRTCHSRATTLVDCYFNDNMQGKLADSCSALGR